MVDGCQCGTGDHIRRAWTDRGCACKCLHAIFHFRESAGHMYSGLFIADENIREVRILLQCLTDACHVAMTKDAKHACKELDFLPIAPNVLVLQEFDDGLRGRQSDCRHKFLLIHKSVKAVTPLPIQDSLHLDWEA